jgi:catechol 2,3-dioxygenase-like lactoylglutathione lyase family enzyme
MPVITPSAFSHINIKVSNLDRSLHFYERVLGFRLVYDNSAKRAQDRVLIGIVAGTALELTLPGDGISTPRDATSAGYSCITFSVPDVDAAYAALLAEGVACEGSLTTLDTGTRLAFFRDPDGNLLEVIDFKGPITLAELFERRAGTQGSFKAR